jgi:hypothetical protein
VVKERRGVAVLLMQKLRHFFAIGDESQYPRQHPHRIAGAFLMTLRKKSRDPSAKQLDMASTSSDDTNDDARGDRENLMAPLGRDYNDRADAGLSASSQRRPWLDRLLGPPSQCRYCDAAEVTTMEKRYHVHPRIAEFWCAVTSPFYALGLLVYACPRERWAPEWQELSHLPTYVHTANVLSVLLAIASTVYHAVLWELLGSVDCSIAIIVWFAVTLSTFGVPLLQQALILVPQLVVFLFLWRRSTRMAVIAGGIVFPLSMWSCILMRWQYGTITLTCLSLGVVCFILDRHKIAPLHPLWHILSAVSLLTSVWETVEGGPVSKYFEGREFY